GALQRPAAAIRRPCRSPSLRSRSGCEALFPEPPERKTEDEAPDRAATREQPDEPERIRGRHPDPRFPDSHHADHHQIAAFTLEALDADVELTCLRLDQHAASAPRLP